MTEDQITRERADDGRGLYVLATILRQHGNGKDTLRLFSGWRAADNRQAAIGAFVEGVQADPENIGFALTEILCSRIPDETMIAASPQGETT